MSWDLGGQRMSIARPIQFVHTGDTISIDSDRAPLAADMLQPMLPTQT
jgi:hypothetical protein